jgi:hypothetical protein
VSKLIGCGPTDPEVRSILAAAEWLFDSRAELNQTIAVIQVSVGLEALLSDGKKQSGRTTALLADRFAMLLGRSQTERAKLRDDFEAFYERRSDIVHGRDYRLKDADSNWCRWAQEKLNALIQHEMGLVETNYLKSKGP